MPDPTCPKCRTAMQEGFILELAPTAFVSR